MDFLFIVFEKIACSFPILSFNYLNLYIELVEKEIKMADISSDDFILVIGGGSLPVTSTILGMKTKAEIVSIDYDISSIDNASRFIENLNLESKIHLDHANGINYPVEKFDVIFVVYGVKKSKEILEYLADNMKKSARIVFRTQGDLQDKILEDSIDLPRMFYIKTIIKSKTFHSVDSYILTKNILCSDSTYP